jgi:hypothetical protein
MQLKLWQWTIQLSGHSMIETNWKTRRVWEWGLRDGKSFHHTCRGTIRQPLFLNGMPWFANNYDAERNLSIACWFSCKAQLTNFKTRFFNFYCCTVHFHNVQNTKLRPSVSCRGPGTHSQQDSTGIKPIKYRGADQSLARPTSLYVLFDGENISFDASLVIYLNTTNIPPIMIINKIYDNQNPLSL